MREIMLAVRVEDGEIREIVACELQDGHYSLNSVHEFITDRQQLGGLAPRLSDFIDNSPLVGFGPAPADLATLNAALADFGAPPVDRNGWLDINRTVAALVPGDAPPGQALCHLVGADAADYADRQDILLNRVIANRSLYAKVLERWIAHGGGLPPHQPEARRQVVLNALSVSASDGTRRLAEIVAVELVQGRPVRAFEAAINPELAEFNEGMGRRPAFADGIAESFRDFVGDAEILVHAPPEQLGTREIDLINAELLRAGQQPLRGDRIRNCWALAKDFHGQKEDVSIHALAKSYGIDPQTYYRMHDGTRAGALLEAAVLAQLHWRHAHDGAAPPPRRRLGPNGP